MLTTELRWMGKEWTTKILSAKRWFLRFRKRSPLTKFK